MIDLGIPLTSSGRQNGNQNLPSAAKLSSICTTFSSGRGFFVRDLFLQSSLGTLFAHLGPIWALIWFFFRSVSDSILFNFAVHWPRYGKPLPSGMVKMRNSRRDDNSLIQNSKIELLELYSLNIQNYKFVKYVRFDIYSKISNSETSTFDLFPGYESASDPSHGLIANRKFRQA